MSAICPSVCMSANILRVRDPYGPVIITSVLRNELLLYRSAHVLLSHLRQILHRQRVSIVFHENCKCDLSLLFSVRPRYITVPVHAPLVALIPSNSEELASLSSLELETLARGCIGRLARTYRMDD